MTNPRKKIILNEILFWKQNKLLPEHYCDFLATLYAEGNDIEDLEDANHKQAILPTEKRKMIFLAVSLFIGAFIVLYLLFTLPTATWILSIVVSILAIILMIIAFQSAKKNGLLSPIFHILAMLLFFGLSIKLSSTYFAGNNSILFGLIAMNCIIWFVSGIKLKRIYFTASGVIGLIALVGYYVWNLT
ncbi:MAG: hypothetical protein RR595_09190 [Lysinibacillus sp.]